MKKKTLISSILTIVLCFSLIAGSTFALFTDETNFNIAVTAGNVDVEAYATIAGVYSAKGVAEGETAKTGFLIDENNKHYFHDKQADNETFSNGGTAVLTGVNKKDLTISRLTPGDRVDLKINVTNKSNVAIVYRYIITIKSDNGLADGMVLTVDGEAYEGFESYTSAWYPVVAAKGGNPDAIAAKDLTVELPVYAGNEFQNKSVDYTVSVEAVQANAVTDNEALVTVLPSAFQKMVNNRDVVTANGGTLDLEECLEITGTTTIVDAVIKGENADAGDAVVPLLVWGGDLTLGQGATVTTGDYGVFVMGGDKLTLDAGSKIVVNDGTVAAINGQVATSVFELYLNDTGLIVDEAGNVAANARIALLCGGTFKIYVPSVEAYNEYLPMVDTDTTYQKIEWYIDGKPLVTGADDLKNTLADPTVSEVYVDEDITTTLTLENVSNKTIDFLDHEANLEFKGTMNNVVIKNVTTASAGRKINVNGATGNLTILDSEFTFADGGTSNIMFYPGANSQVTVKNCVVTGNGHGYAVWSTAAGNITFEECKFNNLGSWAVLINGTQYGDLIINKCEFTNCSDGIAKSGVAGGGASGKLEGNFVFTNNIIKNCAGHDGLESKWFTVSYTGTATISGNTLDGADWVPGEAQGIKAK